MNPLQWYLHFWLAYLTEVMPSPQMKPENTRLHLVWTELHGD